MQVTLLYYDPHHTALGQPLEAGKRIIFGSGLRADLLVSGDGIAEAHFAIENDGEGVWVHQLVDSMAPVLLNDRPVTKSEIDDGDTVAAGNTKVRIQIRNRDLSKAPVPQQPLAANSKSFPPVVKPKQVPRVVGQLLPTGLAVYRTPDGTVTVHEVIKILLTKFEPVVLANFRVTGDTPPESLMGEDLLIAAPKEITYANSLHLVFPGDFRVVDPTSDTFGAPDSQRDALLKLFHQLRPKTGVILAFTNTAKPEVLKSIGFRRGFYCSPDSFEMFLRQGSRELAHALIERFSAVLIGRATDDGWTLYVDSETSAVVRDLETLNISAAMVS